MTRKCVVCNKLYIKGSDETFHSFPKDETRKKMWLKACKIKLCLPSNKICGDHFLPEHYLLSGYLTKDAVPFLAPTSMDKPLNAQCTSSPCPIPIKLPCIERTASTSTDKPLNDQCTSSPCPIPIKLPCIERTASTSTDKPLNDQCISRPCPVPMKIPCIKSIVTTSTDKPLNDQCTSSPCPIPMKSSCVKPIASMNTDITYSPESRKRKILNSSTIGALSPSHFSSPRKAKRHLDMVKNKFKEKQVQNNNLKNKIYRLKKKIEKDGEYIQSLNRLLKEKEHKEILNANIIGALTPSQLISAKKAKTRLDTKKNKFKERQIENRNLKNQIQSPKNYTVQQDHDYTIFT
ncbi:uncharacterized protein LOC100161574 isoform X3 [Acyrthosiphon pisum]|uniref:THAP-type domain-containing protein n=1 Tax=Acyrthosiphon pisum TaxID=7029 RepID=A0A8R2FCI7_ACYPI|nr:uncharacterized protein LOC100161574 isoform X3 [Acyrthosiphon pisum]|eukprot:XP_008188356.1 PREDICTED: uncharacterized protein LOC100161574 isoform X4 [Acyrthosiphon pisum]